MWERSWSVAGWTPVVLSEKDAMTHPYYHAFKIRVGSYPLAAQGGGRDYEVACYLRHLAMANVGGGWLTDYDVFNVNLPPPPNCDWLPNDGKFTTRDAFIPAVTTGTSDEFLRVAREIGRASCRERV